MMRVPAFIRRDHLALLACAALAVNQIRVTMDTWGKFIMSHPGYADFGSYYVYARVGLHAGWSHLYDLAAQRQEWLALGGSDVIPWFPIIYPPPLAWIVTPLAGLPLSAASACWSALLIGLMLLTWRLVSDGWSPPRRWTALAMALALFPVLFALLLGQVLVMQLAAVAGAWWFLVRGREIPAGLLLSALLFKPQLLFLVPLALLVAGRWRTFVSWACVTAAVGLVSVATTGMAGVREYAHRLADAAAVGPQYLVPTQFTLPGIFGRGLPTSLLQGLIVLVALALIYRHRAKGPSMTLVAAIVGSMLVTPYLHGQDLAMLFLAGGIALHAPLSRSLRIGLLVGYLELLAISYWGLGSLGWLLGPMLVLSEVAWLLMAWHWDDLGSRARGVELIEVPLDRTA